jgi:hypothetical protein
MMTALTLTVTVTLLVSPYLSYVQAQSPSLTATPYDYGVRHRQSVCERQQLFFDANGTMDLRDTLAGLQLRPILELGRLFQLDERNVAIPTQDPGILVVLLDEVAARGGFTWRESYGVLSVADRGNRTFSELVKWSVETYDIIVSRVAVSIDRMASGVSFPKGWYDARLIMVGIEQDDSSSLDVWSFTKPFSASVWGLIVVTLCVSGLIYMGLEGFDGGSDSQVLEGKPLENVFLASLMLMGHFEYQPTSNGARLLTLSLAFFCLLVASAYTANLASYLVVDKVSSIRIDSVEDAVRQGYRICVVDTTIADESLTRAFPAAKSVRKLVEKDIYAGVRSGECEIALTSFSSWQEFSRDSGVNGDCQMSWIGRVFRDGEAGFATISDSGSLCTSLIRDVVNLLLVEMKNDGFIDRTWESELDKIADKCDSSADSQDDESGQLTIQAMGGTFILHFGLTAIAICISVFTKYCATKKAVREQNLVDTTSQKTVAEQSVERDVQKLEVGSDDNDDGFDKLDTQASYRKALRNQKQKMNEVLELMKAIQSESDAIYERMHSEPII